MLTLGSIPRATLAETFPFMGERFNGRRAAITRLTHAQPDFVFWIHPDGRLHDARNAHARNYPKGYGHVVNDPPDYGGFLRGRVVTANGYQLVVVYCRPEALAAPGPKLTQFLDGISAIPVPIRADAVVISDNADLYGTLLDLEEREMARR